MTQLSRPYLRHHERRGFFGDRAGWHLPGFDDCSWPSTTLASGMSGAGVRYFRTPFDLNVPAGFDVKITVVRAVWATSDNGAKLSSFSLTGRRDRACGDQ
ncbi:hypothetical protein C8R45DRAFT_1115769 [Mycena sanguinolenta]|nr:hypothetical protein C8R45DRAFT_1115769 [Mycena sanguinolenta]